MKRKKQDESLMKSLEGFKNQISGVGLDDLKAFYTVNLNREKEIIAFIDNVSIPRKKREKRASELTEISLRRYYLFSRIKESGYLMTEDEIQDGFISK